MFKKLLVSIVIFTAFSYAVAYAVNYTYNTSIDNEGSHKYKAVRLTPQIYNKIRQDMADLELYDDDNQPIPYFINSFGENEVNPEISTEEQGNITVVKIQGVRNLKLSSITLNTDSIFKRKVTFDGSVSKVLYNLDFSNTSYKDLTLPLYSHRVTSDTVEITIDNKDDKPIKVSGIEVKYLADELVFDGSKSNGYTLRFGNNEVQNPKNYDISNYKELILKDDYDVLDVKEIKEEFSKTPVKTEYDYKLIFNIAISVAAVVMGIIVFSKLKKRM